MAETINPEAASSQLFLNNLREQLLEIMDITLRRNRPESFQRILDSGRWEPAEDEMARGNTFLEPYNVAARFIALDHMIAIAKMEMQAEPGLEGGADQAKANYWAGVIATKSPERFQDFCRAILVCKQTLTEAIRNGADLQTITASLDIKNLLNIRENNNF